MGGACKGLRAAAPDWRLARGLVIEGQRKRAGVVVFGRHPEWYCVLRLEWNGAMTEQPEDGKEMLSYSAGLLVVEKGEMQKLFAGHVEPIGR